jgi:hypothetical protein
MGTTDRLRQSQVNSTSNMTNFTFPDPREVQRRALAHIAIRAVTNLGMKPTQSMLDRVEATNIQLWGSERNYRSRPRYSL